MKPKIAAAALTSVLLCSAAAPGAMVQWNDGSTLHEYQAVIAPDITWDDARAAAQGLGPGWDLATITSAVEQEFVWANMPSLVGQYWETQFWLGGYQELPVTSPDAGWAWVTGEAWDFTAWIEGEPNEGEEHYLATRGWDWNNSDGPFWVGSFVGFLAERTIIGGSYPIRIDIKPGSPQNRIQPGSIGVVPVAIISQPGWDAPSQVDRASLTFGRTGGERSFVSCNRATPDLNADGLPDLMCHFSTVGAGFAPGDTQGTMRGKTKTGVSFSGSDALKTVPR